MWVWLCDYLQTAVRDSISHFRLTDNKTRVFSNTVVPKSCIWAKKPIGAVKVMNHMASPDFAHLESFSSFELHHLKFHVKLVLPWNNSIVSETQLSKKAISWSVQMLCIHSCKIFGSVFGYTEIHPTWINHIYYVIQIVLGEAFNSHHYLSIKCLIHALYNSNDRYILRSLKKILNSIQPHVNTISTPWNSFGPWFPLTTAFWDLLVSGVLIYLICPWPTKLSEHFKSEYYAMRS